MTASSRHSTRWIVCEKQTRCRVGFERSPYTSHTDRSASVVLALGSCSGSPHRFPRCPPSKPIQRFVMRHVEGIELEELATACRVSLSTIKRRLARAEQRFAAIATRDPVLREWL